MIFLIKILVSSDSLQRMNRTATAVKICEIIVASATPFAVILQMQTKKRFKNTFMMPDAVTM